MSRAILLDDATEEVLRDDFFREAVGQAAVHSSIATLVQAHFRDGIQADALKDFLREELLKPLRAEVRPWRVIIPLSNLAVAAPLAIGPVTLDAYEPTLREVDALFSCRPPAATMEEQRNRDSKRGLAVGVLSQSKAFARVLTEAHPAHCETRGQAVAEIALNLLRSFTHLFYPHEQRAHFGLVSEAPRGTRMMLAMEGAEGGRFQVHKEHSGPLSTFELDAGKIEHLKAACAFDEAIRILAKERGEWTSLEVALVQASRTLGRSVIAQSHDDSFLGCIVAIECLLIPKGTDATVERFSDRLALLLGRDPEERQQISRSAKRLYGLRSDMVHAAYAGIPEDDYILAESWAIGVLVHALSASRTVTAHASFCADINARKYGTRP